MGDADDSFDGEYGETKISDREGSSIRFGPRLPELQTLSSGKSRDEWGTETFRDAGEATFGKR